MASDDEYARVYRWSRPAVLPEKQFEAAAADCRLAVEALEKVHGGALYRGFLWDAATASLKPAGRPVFSRSEIRFRNGTPSARPHVFAVYRSTAAAREPDGATHGCAAEGLFGAAVRACLVVLSAHFRSGTFRAWESPETGDGWEDARNLCQSLFGYGLGFTPGRPPVRYQVGGLGVVRKYAPAAGERDDVYLDGTISLRVAVLPGPLKVVRVYDNSQARAKFVAAAATLRTARWLATVHHVRRAFAGVPFLDEFTGPMAASPGEWLGMRMWVDRLIEAGEEEAADRVRAALPVRLAAARPAPRGERSG